MDQALLEQLKKRLLETRERLIPTVNNIEDSIRENVRAADDISNAPTHMATEDEDGVARSIALARNEEAILEEVEAALARIEQGTYGRCEDCGREISRERLAALPFTRYCIQCAERHDEVLSVEP